MHLSGSSRRRRELPFRTSQSSARAVNSAGWAVGTDSSAFAIPFLYDGTNTYRLSDLIPSNSGWDLSMNTSSSALGIGEDGVIVGTGVHNGETHVYAMVPVAPSPTPTPIPTATAPPTATATVTATATGTPTPRPTPRFHPTPRPRPTPPAATLTSSLVVGTSRCRCPDGAARRPYQKYNWPCSLEGQRRKMTASICWSAS